jgi:hypothetical protein
MIVGVEIAESVPATRYEVSLWARNTTASGCRINLSNRRTSHKSIQFEYAASKSEF